MCAAWKKKNERNEIVCFYCTQSDILLCGIARFSRGNKNKLRTFQPQKLKKIKNSQPQTKFTGSYKKKSALQTEWLLDHAVLRAVLDLYDIIWFWRKFCSCINNVCFYIGWKCFLKMLFQGFYNWSAFLTSIR